MPKWGAEFVSPDHPQPGAIEFAEAWDKSMPLAWQVRRSELDEILFPPRTSRRCGRHRRLPRAPGRLRCRRSHRTGRSRRRRRAPMARALCRRCVRPRHPAVPAVRRQAARNPSMRAPPCTATSPAPAGTKASRRGNISIFWFQHGWVLVHSAERRHHPASARCAGLTTCTGARSRCPSSSPTPSRSARQLARRLDGATLLDDRVWATGNYTYSRHPLLRRTLT